VPRVAGAAHDLAEYLLFADEAPLPSTLDGGCGFAARFASGGARDSRGRSLRDFDLRRRLSGRRLQADAFVVHPQDPAAAHRRSRRGR